MKRIIVVMVLVLAMGMVGCGNANNSDQVQNVAAENFLLKFFTVEDTDSYDVLLNITEKGGDLEAETKATADYFEPYREAFSEEGFMNFKAKGYLFTLQSIAKEKGYVFQTDSMQFVMAEDGKALDFKVDVQVGEKDGASSCTVTQEGQIILNEEDKIDGVWFYNFGDLYDPKLSPGVS